ncbi:hypothetical protein C8Q74DRAFT_1371859 [Fomes fomentarius]|nr:hypothetical protein C8Q74DRAFT_1371859 [Fomes fomentarius]
MIKLLGQELRRANAEIHELQLRQNTHAASIQNARSTASDGDLHALQEDNVRLKSKIDNVRAQLRDSGHSEERNIELISRWSELDAAAAERQKDEHKGAHETLEKKIELARAKYHKAKTTRSTLQKWTSERQAQLDAIESERTEVMQQVDRLQNDLRDLQSKSPFNLWTFIREPRAAYHVAFPAIVLTTTTSKLVLPPAISELCALDGFMLKTREELVWSPTSPGKTHYLDFGPSHRYNPELKASTGAWEPASNQKGRDACSDLFYLQQRAEGPSWRYMGTYQCVGERLCRMKEIEDVMHTHVYGSICQGTMLAKEMIPPLLTGMVKNMYECGALKIMCRGWIRIGFNQKLVNALSEGDMLVTEQYCPSEGMPTVFPVPTEGARARKRIRDEESEPGPSSKKR